MGAQLLADPGGGGGPGPGGAREPGEVGDEAGRRVVRPLVGDDGRVLDRRVGAEGGGHLAGFDAVAPDLHLVVGAADDLQGAVRAQPGQVAGAVHAAAGRPAGLGGEAFGGLPGAAQIALGQPVAREVQLAGDPRGQRGEAPAEDEGAGVPQGGADVRCRGVRRVEGCLVDQMVVSVGP